MLSNLVTIGVPCHNEEAYIEECLLSAIQQDIDAPYSVIVSDNGSTDRTLKKIKDVISRYKIENCATSIISNDCNIGANENFKLVFDSASSKYFMWLGAHDYITKDFLRKSIDLLEGSDEYSMASGLPCGIYSESDKPLFDTFKVLLHKVFTQKENNRGQKEHLTNIDNSYWESCITEWTPPARVQAAIYDFSQTGSFDRYLNSVKLLSNCTVFHSVFEKRLLEGYKWSHCPSADHVIISRLLWYGKLGYSNARYVRRYFPRRNLEKKITMGYYTKNRDFFEAYLEDFESLADGFIGKELIKSLSSIIFTSLRKRFGLPLIDIRQANNK